MRPQPLLVALLSSVACGDDEGFAPATDPSTTSTSSGSSSGTATEASSSGSGSESSTTGPVPCMGNEDCMDAAAPFCELGSGECVRCDGVEDPDGACAGADPGLPVCEGGMCVQCTAANPGACGGKTPVCDAATNTCVPCNAHDQCGPAACNLFTGACLPVDAVVHVGGSEPDFATLGEALLNFGADQEGTIVVHAGMESYDEAISVSAGRTIAFLAAEIGPGIEPPRWIRSSGNVPQLTVAAGTTVLVDGVELSGNLSSMVPAVDVDGGRAWFDRSRVAQNAGGGILAQNGAELWVDRTRVVQNDGGGILAQSNAELVLRNCFVSGADNTAAVDVDTATARITFSTLGGDIVNATGLSCTSPNALEIRNSIIVALGIEGTGGVDVACTVADISFSATELDFAGMGNVAVGELPLMTPEDWFVGYGTGDFHLQNDGLDLFADIAQWQAGDPPTDIDGDPRPMVDGTPDYAGADLPVMAAAPPEADR